MQSNTAILKVLVLLLGIKLAAGDLKTMFLVVRSPSFSPDDDI